ncbi:MAG: PTS fructose IIA subunit family protein, partial [Xanthomonadales bacterium]|nr:PTS fructose IIA subunit family protein [Xanthomonadales bacterium]
DSLERALDAVELGGGVLVLTDLQGASPANRALRAAHSPRACRVVAGLNLPMLLRVLNYRAEALDDLARIAVEGGVRGVGVLD